MLFESLNELMLFSKFRLLKVNLINCGQGPIQNLTEIFIQIKLNSNSIRLGKLQSNFGLIPDRDVNLFQSSEFRLYH